MTGDEASRYLTQCCNMSLDLSGETSFTNSFRIKVLKDGFLFIPRLPASYILDNDLYQRIYKIANSALYPFKSLLKQSTMYQLPLILKTLATKEPSTILGPI